MENEIKINKTDLIFYSLAERLAPIILRFEFFKKLLKFTRGVCEERFYKDYFNVLVSKSMLYFLLSLVIASFLIIMSGLSKGIVLIDLVIISTLTSLPFTKVKREYEKNEFELNIALENYVNELAILIASGMSLDASIKLNRTNRDTYYVIKKFFKYIEDASKKGLSTNSAILGFSKIYNNKFLNKLNVIISQSNKKGTSKQAESLINLGVEIMNERKNKVKKKAETISTKMLMPLMVSMIGIILMIMVPIFMQF